MTKGYNYACNIYAREELEIKLYINTYNQRGIIGQFLFHYGGGSSPSRAAARFDELSAQAATLVEVEASNDSLHPQSCILKLFRLPGGGLPNFRFLL